MVKFFHIVALHCHILSNAIDSHIMSCEVLHHDHMTPHMVR